MEADREIPRRLRSALLDSLEERDLEALDSQAVAVRAGVTVDAFEEHYGTLDQCVRATYQEVVDELYRRAAGALRSQDGDWQSRLVGTIATSLEHLDEVPGAARLCLVESARTGDAELHECRSAARQRYIRLVADEYRRCEEPELPDLHFEFVIGAIYHAVHEEVVAGGRPGAARAQVRELLGVLEPAAA
ncbi:MAG: TetR/AcrR family transcriptional regulator [Thermoleophilaceae bacterium]